MIPHSHYSRSPPRHVDKNIADEAPDVPTIRRKTVEDVWKEIKNGSSSGFGFGGDMEKADEIMMGSGTSPELKLAFQVKFEALPEKLEGENELPLREKFQISQGGSAFSMYDFNQAPQGDFRTHESISRNIYPAVEETEGDAGVMVAGSRSSKESQSVGSRLIWSLKEDKVMLIGLIENLCNENKNSKTKGSKFWYRVADYYNEIRLQIDNDPNVRKSERLTARGKEHCRQRYKRLSRDCSEWASALKEAKAQQRSGKSDTDLIEEAQEIYTQRGNGGVSKKKFADFHVWEILKELPKWKPKDDNVNEGCAGSSSKRAKLNENGDHSASYPVKTPTSSCPTSQVKGKTKVNPSLYTQNEYIEALERISVSREHEITLQREMLEIERVREREKFQLEREKEAGKQRRMDMKLYEILSRKSNLDSDEEEFKRKLVRKLCAD